MLVHYSCQPSGIMCAMYVILRHPAQPGKITTHMRESCALKPPRSPAKQDWGTCPTLKQKLQGTKPYP